MTRQFIAPGILRKRRSPEPAKAPKLPDKPSNAPAPKKTRSENHHVNISTETVADGWKIIRSTTRGESFYDGIKNINFNEHVNMEKDGVTKYFSRSYDRNGDTVTISGSRGYTKTLPASDSTSAEEWLEEPEISALIEDQEGIASLDDEEAEEDEESDIEIDRSLDVDPSDDEYDYEQDS